MTKVLRRVLVLIAFFFHRCFERTLASSAFVRSARRRRSRPSSVVVLSSVHHSDASDDTISTLYQGPLFSGSEMTAIAELAEWGLDLAVGPSMVAGSGQMGLYVRCSDGVASVTLSECTLLCGYSRAGVFRNTTDVGDDKTVGFALPSAATAVFYERRLMEVRDALAKAATDYGACGLAGHALAMTTTSDDDGDDEEEVWTIRPTSDDYDRFFCPQDVVDDTDGRISISVQNFGKYCNDLAWNQLAPPETAEEYLARSAQHNAVQLVWRLAYDATLQCLVPTWPVSVLARDVTFENHQFMELGTRYGWNYWQATVQLENLV